MARLLLVDDHDIVRKSIRTLLRDHPEWEIVGEAANGADGVARARELKPALVLLDINMPVMTGLEALRQIAQLEPAPRVLMFTIVQEEEMLQAAREAGAHGYVVKSRASRDLVPAVEELLSGGTFWRGST